MKAIPSYHLLKQCTVCHADTPRHGHGSLPRTEAAPTEPRASVARLLRAEELSPDPLLLTLSERI